MKENSVESNRAIDVGGYNKAPRLKCALSCAFNCEGGSYWMGNIPIIV